MINWMKDRKNLVIALLVIACAWLLLRNFSGPAVPRLSESASEGEALASQEIWTCSMHPQIQMPKPGKCPICGMDLIRMTDEDAGGPWELKLSPQARKLAGIRTAQVVRRKIAHEVRMVGKIDYDEKRVSDISARVAGRIDRLFVDFTGIRVSEGDHLVAIYSPDLVTAQQELRQAVLAYESGPESLKSATARRREAARKKLSLLGMTAAQIREIEGQKEPSQHITITSPMSGIVIKKHLNEGAYVATGTPIYTVADLSRVWVVLEAYEADLRWLRFGQEVSFEVAAFPGETHKGRIIFIDPVLNPDTRTVEVTIDIPNPDLRFKPDMFVRAVAYASLAPNGKVMDPSLKGKWISPMHPEVVKGGPGKCDVCGMDLVKAESLGFVTAEDETAPLVIPASAALVTGERAVVYVADGEDEGRYEGREVVLGPESGEYYVVKSGLKEGEWVVVNGAFKIDSELQIRAKYSMMYHPESPAPKTTRTQSADPAFVTSLQPLYDAYFAVQTDLSKDRLQDASGQGAKLLDAIAKVAGDKLAAEPGRAWQGIEKNLQKAARALIGAKTLAEARTHFEGLSLAVQSLAETFPIPGDSPVLRFHCPMAFDNRGADWLQNHQGTENPYFGSAMFSCGSQEEDLRQVKGQEDGHQAHGGDHDHR